jgi:D-alanyl-lipoteichoic acid acyltransferase DltB (MBOAT superfamily)
VDKVYAVPAQHQATALVLATFAFAWQIYFDFSGYTDMARGIARMMGFRLMLNFNNPYLATSLGDFWSRWHISLSTWFKDYVYVPLGGNRRGEFRTYLNMFLTMVISGLWHGAAWTFVMWGLLHALGRVATRWLEATRFYRDRVPKVLKQASVFAFVTFTWIFFRARSFADAWTVVARIAAGIWQAMAFAFDTFLHTPFSVGGLHNARAVVIRFIVAVCSDSGFPLLALGMVLAVWAYQFLYESRGRWVLQLAPVRVGLVILMILYMALACGAESQPFYYFQF